MDVVPGDAAAAAAAAEKAAGDEMQVVYKRDRERGAGRRPCTASVNAGDYLSSSGVGHDILVWTFALPGRSSGGRGL